MPFSGFRLPAPSAAGVLVWLMVALVPGFAVTAAVTQAYRAEQRRLAAEWFARGEAALASGDPDEAIEALRNAMTFSREDRTFRLRLAQALTLAGRTAEARAYLLTLREAQPGSGPVNLELGRLATREANVPDAVRYYHAAIEGAWTEAAEVERRAARFELAQFLVEQGAETQAQAELITLHGDLPPERAARLRVARLMAHANLRNRALALYNELAKSHPRDAEILRDAGLTAFDAGSYATAVTYLSRAIAAGAPRSDLEAPLDVARLVLALDPFQRRLSTRERAARARRGFEAAAARLRGCPEEARTALSELVAEADAIAPGLTRLLRRDPDAIESVIDLAFRIEQAVPERCGPPKPVDRALLLLAQQRTGGGP